jgi:hypothetical protein
MLLRSPLTWNYESIRITQKSSLVPLTPRGSPLTLLSPKESHNGMLTDSHDAVLGSHPWSKLHHHQLSRSVTSW